MILVLAASQKWEEESSYIKSILSLKGATQSQITLFLVYWQFSEGWKANFPAFIASKSFDLWNHQILQIKCDNLRHILTY
jgi:hypothetical protein